MATTKKPETPLDPEIEKKLAEVARSQRNVEKHSKIAKEWLDRRNEQIREVLDADPDLSWTVVGRRIGVTYQAIRKIVQAGDPK